MNNHFLKNFSYSSSDLLIAAGVFLTYFLTAQFALFAFFELGIHPALLWAPVGIGLAAGINFGYRMWVPVFLAQFFALLSFTFTPDGFIVAFTIAAAYSFQLVASLYILNRYTFTKDLGKARNVILLLVISFALTVIEPTAETAVLMVTGLLEGSPLLNWSRAYGAGIFSILVITPCALMWFPIKKLYFPRKPLKQIEIGAAFAALFAANYIVFWTDFSQFLGITIIFILPAVLIWFALRIHPRWLALAVVISAIQAIAGAVIAHTSDNPINQQLLSIEIYLGLVAAIFYIFVAVVDERRVAFKQLSLTFKEIVAADTAKNEFIAILAHELRNPLAPIVGSLELLKHSEQSAASLEIIDEAVDHTVMMQRLLDDLLDIARLSQKKILLHKEESSIQTIVKQSLSNVSEKSRSLHHTIEVHHPQEDFTICADPVRIKQILINLLNNALKYTGQGGEIELFYYKEGANLIMCVKDTGVGIEKEKLETIFEPFKQLGEASRFSSGLGIGLYLSRHLARLHDGEVTVSSAGPGKGSTFTVTLPVILFTNPAVPKVASAQSADAAQKILIVDDNKPAADILKKLLLIHKYEVEVAYSGKEALVKAQSFGPSVIFLDIGMPGLDGYETATLLRELSWIGKIVALSGYGQDSDKERSKEAGFDHHLVKPAGIEDILNVLKELSNNSSISTEK